MRRFFLPADEFDSTTPTLRGIEARHATRVLRLKTGDVVEVFDGAGRSTEARIAVVRKQGLELCFTGPVRNELPPRCRIVLAQALLRREKMKLVLQKAVELGADGIWPFECSRSVARAKVDTPATEAERNSLVVLDALKQCRSNRAPEVLPPLGFDEVLARAPSGYMKLFLWEQERMQGLKTVAGGQPSPEGVVLMVGPEGGFTPDEAARARSRGFRTVGLGARVLRAETAAVAILALAQYEWGYLGRDPAKAGLRESISDEQG